MNYQNRTYENTREVIDGNEYKGCVFRNCRIVYRGGPLPRFDSCNFDNPHFFFEDAAERTILLLKGMYHSGYWGKRLIEATVESLIRKP